MQKLKKVDKNNINIKESGGTNLKPFGEEEKPIVKTKRAAKNHIDIRLNIDINNRIVAKPQHKIIKREEVALEGWCSKLSNELAVLILPPSPRFGGTAMNSNVLLIEQAFQLFNASTLRINYSGVGLSTGHISDEANLRDALDLIEWLVEEVDPKQVWIAGYGYGAFLSIHAAMRVPNINGFVAVTPFAEYELDLNLLTPCPNGLLINGTEDPISNHLDIKAISKQLSSQKGCSIQFKGIEGANHHYTNHKNELQSTITNYLADVFEVNLETEEQKKALAWSK